MKNLITEFLLIYFEGDEEKVESAISTDAWIEMPVSRLLEVLEEYTKASTDGR